MNAGRFRVADTCGDCQGLGYLERVEFRPDGTPVLEKEPCDHRRDLSNDDEYGPRDPYDQSEFMEELLKTRSELRAKLATMQGLYDRVAASENRIAAKLANVRKAWAACRSEASLEVRGTMDPAIDEVLK